MNSPQTSLQLWNLTPDEFKIKTPRSVYYNLTTKILIIQIFLQTLNPIVRTSGLYYRKWFNNQLKIIPNSVNQNSKINFVQNNFKLKNYTHSTTANYFNNDVNMFSKNVDYKKNIFTRSSFYTFIKINLASTKPVFRPHNSFKSFYVLNSKGGLAFANIHKFFNKWKMMYYLMFNIFYYKIQFLTFVPSFFKKESLALGWSELKQLSFIWRYIKPFLMYKPNKINDEGEFIFRKLKYLNFNVACVSDVVYHNKTIYYLRRLNFYTFGLVPTIYHAKTLDFAIPTADTNPVMQVFFIRTLLVIKQTSLKEQYNQIKSYWYTCF